MHNTNSYRSNCVAALLMLSFLVVVHNQGEAEPQTNSSTDRLVTFSVHPDQSKVTAGETFLLHFHARIKPEWHIYWKNPGETGMATDISIDAPEGFDVGNIQWPRPITFKTGEITSYGYKDETVLTVPVKAPDALPERPYNFSATITSLVCREKCLMQNQKMSFSLDDLKQPDKAVRGKIRSFRAAEPKPFSSLESSRVSWNKGSVVFHGPRRDAEEIRFYPIAIPGVELGSPSISIDDQTFSVRVPVEWHPENHLGKEKPAVKGVIGLGKAPTDPGYYVSAPLKKEQVAE